MMTTAIALIPARAGSKRVRGKNTRVLAGHPLLAYTIAAAQESRVFKDVIVSTDSEETARIARHYQADVIVRPPELAGDLSPDIEWIEHALGVLKASGRDYEAFSILRPTNPFRSADTIRRAWKEFTSEPGVDSLRAVERCKQHPGKMWILRGRRMSPLLPVQPEHQPWHSSPYQSLPEVYVQTAALEMAWTRLVWQTRTIAGVTIMPFFMTEHEGTDINEPADWERAERLASSGGPLPPISLAAYESP